MKKLAFVLLILGVIFDEALFTLPALLIFMGYALAWVTEEAAKRG